MAFVGNCLSVSEAHCLRFACSRHALGIDRIPKTLDVLLRRQNRFEAQTRLRQLGPGDLGGQTLPSGFVVGGIKVGRELRDLAGERCLFALEGLRGVFLGVDALGLSRVFRGVIVGDGLGRRRVWPRGQLARWPPRARRSRGRPAAGRAALPSAWRPWPAAHCESAGGSCRGCRCGGVRGSNGIRFSADHLDSLGDGRNLLVRDAGFSRHVLSLS